MSKIVIWGAGEFGRDVLKKYGEDNVVCFIDSNETKQGKKYEDKEVISLEDYKERGYDYEIVICARWVNVCAIEETLKKNNIRNFTVYTRRMIESDDLVVNQFGEAANESEEQWNEKLIEDKVYEYIASEVKDLCKTEPIFHEVEIETINRCNGVCSFCPVNSKLDKREFRQMDEMLFHKIINELEEIEYEGRLALFSNNEPFMDKRIIEFAKYAREHCTKAKIFLSTNGTLLSVEKFDGIIDYLDELIIDNYDQELKLIPQVVKIREHVESLGNTDIRKKVKIVLRKPQDILTSRGGDAPNRSKVADFGDKTCTLPFQQMIIRPSGEVSLCCNDPLGKETLGDLNTQSMLEVWYSERYKAIRKQIVDGRKNIEHCRNCDTFLNFN